MAENDGGPAYPFVAWQSPKGMMAVRAEIGMSLRDYFAAAALAYPVGKPGVSAATKAHEAYEIADAMIFARGVK